MFLNAGTVIILLESCGSNPWKQKLFRSSSVSGWSCWAGLWIGEQFLHASIYNNYDLCWSDCLAYRSLQTSLTPQKELQWPRPSRQAHCFLLPNAPRGSPTHIRCRHIYEYIHMGQNQVVRLFASLPTRQLWPTKGRKGFAHWFFERLQWAG